MPSPRFLADLDRYGPAGSAGTRPTLVESRAYCLHLAKSHYENFEVASWLLPRHLRPHFNAIYAWCRWADDLADEVDSSERASELLDWWEAELLQCQGGRATHPVYVALGPTLSQFQLPLAPFLDLLSAFRQDQRVTQYATFELVLDYCRRSANPVGRLLLHLAGAVDATRLDLSDSLCTGLQLANFCQDVAADAARGRIYLPGENWQRLGIAEADFAGSVGTPALRQLLALEVERAERYLRAGLPLADCMPAGWGGDIWLFANGGLKILARIRGLGYDVWSRRPQVTKCDQLYLLAGCVWRNRSFWRRGVA